MIELIRSFLKFRGLPETDFGQSVSKDWHTFEEHLKILCGVSPGQYFEAILHIDNMRGLLRRFGFDEEEPTSEPAPSLSPSVTEVTKEGVETPETPLPFTGLDTGEGVKVSVDPTNDSSLSA